MENKNANNVTDQDLYNGFVWVQENGKAVSMYYGKKIVWSFATGIEEIQKWSIYTQICYAMLVASHTDEELTDMVVDPVDILVEPDGGKPFQIRARFNDTKHAIIGKLLIHHERVIKHGRKNDND